MGARKTPHKRGLPPAKDGGGERTPKKVRARCAGGAGSILVAELAFSLAPADGERAARLDRAAVITRRPLRTLRLQPPKPSPLVA
jgi:hypothetical protein